MRNKKILDVLGVIWMIFLIILGILIIPFILAYFNGNEGQEISEIEDVINSCRNSYSNLENAGSCAVRITSGFYKYNVDNVGKKLSFSELKENGGVCSSWSEYYTEIGKNLGYNAQNFIIPLSGNIYHQFSVWSNGEGYCILDQTELSCFEFNRS